MARTAADLSSLCFSSLRLSDDHPCISALYGPKGSVIFDHPYNNVIHG